MANVVIVYHSGYGHTKRLAEAVHQGASAAAGATADLIAIDADGNLPDGAWERLAAADAVIFGSPTYMGNVSWQFKKFADASSKAWSSQQWKDKIAAGFTNSASTNGDKYNTINYLFTLAMQHGMVWVGTGMMPSNLSASKREDPNWIGAFTGAMAVSPADAGTDVAPVAGDLATGTAFGRRVAEVAVRWRKARA